MALHYQHIGSSSSKYLPLAIDFIFFPIVYHYIFGVGQAIKYRKIENVQFEDYVYDVEVWHIEFNSGSKSWINKKALTILAY